MTSNKSRARSNVHRQDLTKLDVTKLSALSPEVISRQATINIGTIGHVAHEKSTVVKAISGVQTVRFKNELERNITIKLERLPDSVLRRYRQRSDEKVGSTFFEKIKRAKRRSLFTLNKSRARSNVHRQDLTKLDVTKLSALSPEVISRQATINIGTIGHVAHEKSTVVKAISGVQTVRFKNELERNITIKLERLPDSVLRRYRQRSDEKVGSTFFEKIKRAKRRSLFTLNKSRARSNVHRQDLTKLDVTKLSALSPEVISRQATINIGTIGHVAHEKSTVVKAISGVQTVRFKNELERNITIKLERLPDSVLRRYRQRSDEKVGSTFFEKIKRAKRRSLFTLNKSRARSNVHRQDLTKLDVTKLSALSPEVISRQATINIGTIGHVAYEKSTVVKAISGVQTVRFKNELERNITIKLERLPDSVLRRYRQRSDEKVGSTFFEKIKRAKRRSLFTLNKSRARSNVHRQDLTKLDVTKLSALSPEVISRQATINIGTIGHVAHEKSTVVKAISGVQTVRFKNELERNITIKLERLPDSVLRRYRQRSDEKEESTFFEKIKRAKRRSLFPDIEATPPSNKQKKQEPEEYIIEKIIDFKFELGQEMFYIKWEGWDDSENTWEPIEILDNCPDILKEFVENEELKYFDKMEKLKEEISFDDLLSEKNLVDRLYEVEESDLIKLKVSLILKLLSMINLPESEELHVSDLVQEARNTLQLYVSTRTRCRQMVAIRNWEDHLNQVDKFKKLSVENDVDFAGPPENFNYINESIPGAGVTIPNEPPIGCDCVACNCRSKSCCGMQEGLFAYTVQKRLRVASGTPIYECNKACKCSSECNNRVVQKGRNVKLTIFRTRNGCGWGVRAEQKIKQGQFVCQYVGEVITFEEAEKRGKEYDANGSTYLFDLDFNDCENPYAVDACNLGNVSHFINHSCDPNLGVWAVWADCLDPNLPMIALFAIREIEVGEEICFDYLQKCNDNDEDWKTPALPINTAEDDDACVPSAFEANTATSSAYPMESRFEIQEQNITSLKHRTECKCGAVKCRKYLF